MMARWLAAQRHKAEARAAAARTRKETRKEKKRENERKRQRRDAEEDARRAQARVHLLRAIAEVALERASHGFEDAVVVDVASGEVGNADERRDENGDDEHAERTSTAVPRNTAINETLEQLLSSVDLWNGAPQEPSLQPAELQVLSRPSSGASVIHLLDSERRLRRARMLKPVATQPTIRKLARGEPGRGEWLIEWLIERSLPFNVLRPLQWEQLARGTRPSAHGVSSALHGPPRPPASSRPAEASHTRGAKGNDAEEARARLDLLLDLVDESLVAEQLETVGRSEAEQSKGPHTKSTDMVAMAGVSENSLQRNTELPTSSCSELRTSSPPSTNHSARDSSIFYLVLKAPTTHATPPARTSHGAQLNYRREGSAHLPSLSSPVHIYNAESEDQTADSLFEA